jgi:TonB family protein
MKRVVLFLCFLCFVADVAWAAPRAKMLAIPKPVYPAAAIQRRVEGRGEFQIDMDFSTGKPLRVVVVKSTGSSLLDDAAVKALQQWRAAPGTIRVIHLPLVFRLTSRGPSVGFQ